MDPDSIPPGARTPECGLRRPYSDTDSVTERGQTVNGVRDYTDFIDFNKRPVCRQ